MTVVFLISSPKGAESRKNTYFLHLNKSGTVAGVYLTMSIWRWWNWIFLNFCDTESAENGSGWSCILLNWESSQREEDFNNYSASVKGGFCQAAAPPGSDCPRLLLDMARAGSIWCFSELRLSCACQSWTVVLMAEKGSGVSHWHWPAEGSMFQYRKQQMFLENIWQNILWSVESPCYSHWADAELSKRGICCATGCIGLGFLSTVWFSAWYICRQLSISFWLQWQSAPSGTTHC